MYGFQEDVLYPHYMGKHNNKSYHSLSPVGRLYDIVRVIFSDIPLPSFSIPKGPKEIENENKGGDDNNNATDIYNDNNSNSGNCKVGHDTIHDIGYDDNKSVGRKQTENASLPDYLDPDIYGCDVISYAPESVGRGMEGINNRNNDVLENRCIDKQSSLPTCYKTFFSSSSSSTTSLPSCTTSFLLDNLSLGGILFDIDLRTDRASDFLQIATRIYEKYVRSLLLLLVVLYNIIYYYLLLLLILLLLLSLSLSFFPPSRFSHERQSLSSSSFSSSSSSSSSYKPYRGELCSASNSIYSASNFDDILKASQDMRSLEFR